MKIWVVVPAYNEEKRIGEVLKALKAARMDVVIVDDGSKDNTFEEVSKYSFKALRHRINQGKGAALKTGCDAAFLLGAEAVIMMDSDGQHRVKDLPKFIESLETKKYDIVFGSRNLSMGMPLVRFMGNKLASVLISLLYGIYVSDLVCGYRAFTKKGYEKIKWDSSGYGIETEMVIRAGKTGLHRCEVPVETVYYDKFKGVTIIDALGILFSVLKWRLVK